MGYCLLLYVEIFDTFNLFLELSCVAPIIILKICFYYQRVPFRLISVFLIVNALTNFGVTSDGHSFMLCGIRNAKGIVGNSVDTADV
jgi:hypothetical protein